MNVGLVVYLPSYYKAVHRMNLASVRIGGHFVQNHVVWNTSCDIFHVTTT